MRCPGWAEWSPLLFLQEKLPLGSGCAACCRLTPVAGPGGSACQLVPHCSPGESADRKAGLGNPSASLPLKDWACILEGLCDSSVVDRLLLPVEHWCWTHPQFCGMCTKQQYENTDPLYEGTCKVMGYDVCISLREDTGRPKEGIP